MRNGVCAAAALQAPALMAGLSGGGVVGGPNKVAPRSRPNVLFIMTDQQFAEALSCRMGKQYLNTPAMDGLAEHGVFFTRAYTPNPLCMPARQSLFTGRYPHETGVTKNERVDIDPKDLVSMGTYFRQAGYETVYAGKWHLAYDVKDTAAHGFELLHGKGPKQDVDRTCADRIAQFLSQKHDKPFLAVASFVNPHNICQFSRDQTIPSGPLAATPPPEQCPPPPTNLEVPEKETDSINLLRKAYHANPLFPVEDFTADKWRQLRWGYYRLIERVDGEVGKILEALRDAGLENKTVIVLTSDHGDCAGAHRFNQKTVFYEESSRVPLIVSYKGQARKATCDNLVNIGVDVLPTMLDFAGIAIPSKLTGRSLKQLALGQPAPQWRDHLVVENNMCQTGVVDGFRPQAEGRMVRSERYKYCVYQYGNQRESLVDLKEDPLETKNVATDPQYRQVLLDHRKLLAEFARAHNDTVGGEMLANGVGPAPFPKHESEDGHAKKRKKADP